MASAGSMSERIEWKCLGDEYLLTRGTQQRVVPSELWWKSFTGASPTPEELERLWTTGQPERARDRNEKEAIRLAAVVSELSGYLKEMQEELGRMQADAKAGNGSPEALKLQFQLVDAAREQLNAAKDELRFLAN